MRFISMVKSAEANAAPPPKAFLDAMGRLTEEVAKAGCVMIQAEGLLPTPMGARVRLADSKVTVTDGPFTEAKEVVGGFAIFEVQSKAQILDVARPSWIFTKFIFQAGRAKSKFARSRGQAKSCATKPTRRRRPRCNAACGIGGSGVSR